MVEKIQVIGEIPADFKGNDGNKCECLASYTLTGVYKYPDNTKGEDEPDFAHYSCKSYHPTLKRRCNTLEQYTDYIYNLEPARSFVWVQRDRKFLYIMDKPTWLKFVYKFFDWDVSSDKLSVLRLKRKEVAMDAFLDALCD